MKRFPYLSNIAGTACLAVVACLPCFADTTTAPAGDTPPSEWMILATVKEEPAHKIYLGGAHVLSYDPGSHRAERAHWVVWGKFVYKEPQKFNDNLVATELFALHVDCAKSSYSQFRDIKLDDKGQVLEESRTVSKFKPVPKEFDGLGFLPPAESVAEGAQSFTCGSEAE